MTAHRQATIGAWGDRARVWTFLRGSWSLSRQISEGSSMSGTAVFVPADGGDLAYREHGPLRLANGATFQAERRYLFRRRPGGFAVFFAETPPRLFQDIVLSEADGFLIGEGTHRCAADTYLSRYSFSPDGSFAVRHAVHGPRKSYCSETLYCRLGAAPAI